MENKICFGCMEETASEGICPKCGFNAAEYTTEPHQLNPGTILRERYSVGRVLGEGGFGITYVGLDTVLNLKVAVKEFYMSGYVNRNNTHSTTVQANTGTYGETFAKNREKFLGEARVLAKFANEEGIVGIRDYFQENNTAYIVMDFLSGETLRSYIDAKGKLSADKTLEILLPVIKSLGNVHSHNVIHRDISPDNIMLTDNGKVKLLDFGAAREVSNTDIKSLSIILKPGYAPEEQYRSKGQQGPWTDIYALCATIYRCVTGTVPDDSMERMFEDKLVPPSEMNCQCSKAMSNVIMKGLAVRLADRYKSIEELLADIELAKADPENTAIAAPAATKAPAEADRTVFVGSEPATVKVERVTAAGDPEGTVFADRIEAEPAPKTQAPKTAPAAPKTEPAPAPKTPTEPKPKKSKKKILIPIIIAAAVIVIGAVAGIIALVSGLIGGGSGKNTVLDEMPAPLDSYSLTLNGMEISLPTTFEELESAGWVCSDPTIFEEEINAQTAYGSYVTLTNGYGEIDVYYNNYSYDAITVYQCDVYMIQISNASYFDDYLGESLNTLELPVSLVLGESKEKEAKNALPKGYSKSSSYDNTYYKYVASDEYDDSYTFRFNHEGILSGITVCCESPTALREYGYSETVPDYNVNDVYEALNLGIVMTIDGYDFPFPCSIADLIDMGYTLEKGPEFLPSNDHGTVYLRADTFTTLEAQAYNPFDNATSIENCFIDYVTNMSFNTRSEATEEIAIFINDNTFTYVPYEGTSMESFIAFLTENNVVYNYSEGSHIDFYPTESKHDHVTIYEYNNGLSNVAVNIGKGLRSYLGSLED